MNTTNNGKVALVTGAGRDVGREISLALAAAGIAVVSLIFQCHTCRPCQRLTSI